MEQSSCKSTKRRHTPIASTKIKYDIICMILNLILDLACNKCMPKLDLLSFSYKAKTTNDQFKVKEIDAPNIRIAIGQEGKMKQREGGGCNTT